MTIEQATTADAETILALQKRAFQIEAERYNDFSIQPLTQTLESFLNDFESYTIFKCHIDSKIVGSIRTKVIDTTCYIERLIVDPEFHNQGIGSRLLEHIEQNTDNLNRFELFTGFKSEKNLYLYNKFGYREFMRKQVNDSLTFIFLEKSI